MNGAHAFFIESSAAMIVVRHFDDAAPDKAYALVNLDVAPRDDANDLACLDFREYSRGTIKGFHTSISLLGTVR